MTEIEKMFENANAYKMLCNCEFKNLYDYRIGYGSDVCIHVEDELRKDCEGCELAEQNVKYYPPFTAEKQLELIKFLFNHNVYYDVDSKGNYWFHISDDCYTYYYNKFEVALANIINEMWQDLTDQEKEEIRNILNA